MNPVSTKLRTATAILCLAALSLNNALAQTPAEPNRMFIQILEGESPLNDIRSGTAREPIVQIEDENHKPIAGAVVIFSTPNSGPSAIFSNGLTTFKTTTGADGRAIGEGLKPNSVTGEFQIQVSANFGALSSVAVINETNTGKASSTRPRETPVKRGLPLKAIAIVSGIAGGAIVTGVLLSHGSHSDTITAGTPTVGKP